MAISQLSAEFGSGIGTGRLWDMLMDVVEYVGIRWEEIQEVYKPVYHGKCSHSADGARS